ncbi:hypothetical protein TDB9533_02360 [Thalassocella blandensis]|nr:hypothetical protein TDB9533_02360 [Thalassocella blandensis]
MLILYLRKRVNSGFKIQLKTITLDISDHFKSRTPLIEELATVSFETERLAPKTDFYIRPSLLTSLIALQCIFEQRDQAQKKSYNMKLTDAVFIGFTTLLSTIAIADNTTDPSTEKKNTKPNSSSTAENSTINALSESITLETDWLELTPGYIGKILGAEITKIEKPDDKGMSRIEITIPNDKQRNIEEVIVRGKRGNSEYDLTLDQRVEVIKDLEAGKTGIVVHVGGNKPFKLLINYIDYNQDSRAYQ